jgi:hypothetical protein
MIGVGIMMLSSVSVTKVALASRIKDVLAKNCEIFIDKAITTQSSHAYTTVHFYLKVLPGHLDGAVTRVGVVHDRQESRRDRAPEEFAGRWTNLPSFMGSQDYFVYQAVTGHDWMSASEVASFFVETSEGTRYWLNSDQEPGQGFIVDSDLASSIAESVWVYPSADLGRAPKTADLPSNLAQDLNPQRCR